MAVDVPIEHAFGTPYNKAIWKSGLGALGSIGLGLAIATEGWPVIVIGGVGYMAGSYVGGLLWDAQER
jgi:hypothetical protein